MKRREFIKLSAGAAAGVYLSSKMRFLHPRVFAAQLIPGLSDPTLQPKFVEAAPNALDPGFFYGPTGDTYIVEIGENPFHMTGLVNPSNNNLLETPIFGYGQNGSYTWPGRSFKFSSGELAKVQWVNNLPDYHILTGLNNMSVVDTSLHWCFSLPGYTGNSIGQDGVPIITHLHGGHTDFQFDGNPEFFYTPNNAITGPQWANVPGGFTNIFTYDTNVVAGTPWYHDHALGITRLNVYAGMAGFFFIRDNNDTGLPNNPLGLPAYPYELAYAIQDRMFKESGELFYPAFPGDPAWAAFITGLGLADDAVPQPSALAEFFGDHILVNGKIWPLATTGSDPRVEPRNYRMRLLNGCDSRFLVLQFQVAGDAISPIPPTDLANAGPPLPFWVIGSDQGLAFKATNVTFLIMGPGERYDIVFDFSQVPFGSRVIMSNLGGDAPYGGGVPGPGPYTETDRVMAFDVTKAFDTNVPDNFNQKNVQVYVKNKDKADRVRKVALFEGMDEFGRLQPLLGTAEPATDYAGNPINWPDDSASGGPYSSNGLVGQMQGAMAWHSPTTENPALNTTEIWEIYNATADAHPVHLHLVHFEVLDRQKFNAKLVPQPVVQHNGEIGQGFQLTNLKVVGKPVVSDGVERAPKDMVTALPGEVTRIKVKFDKPGRYVWHCHILSHEDHEMMRVLHVGPGA